MNRYLVLLMLFSGALCSVPAQWGSGQPASPPWWFSSSLADTSEGMLFHAEGQYSYARMTGATEGETQSGGARIAIRKNRFTHQSVYRLDKIRLKLKSLGMNYVTESQIFSDYLDVDLSPLVYGEGGFIWERDQALLIKNRYSGYVGAGLNGMLSAHHYLNVLSALGRVDQHYAIPVDRINVVHGAYTLFYFRQMYQYTMDRRLSLMEQAAYQVNLNDAERYRISLDLSVTIGIVEPVSLVLGYTYKYDKEVELLGSFAANTTQTIGVRISL